MKCWKAIILLFGGMLCACSLEKQGVNFYDYNVIAHACGGKLMDIHIRIH